MTDNPLTEWARLEVQKMIDATIERYDIKQDARHRENATKLDRNANAVDALQDKIEVEFKGIRQSLAEAKTTFAQSQGVEKYKQWIFPTLLTLGLVIIGIIDLLKR